MKQKNNKLFVKNMVCPRCILTVETILKKLSIPYSNISLGEIDFLTPVGENRSKLLDKELKNVGFELIEKRVNKIVENIKRLVLQYIGEQPGDKRLKLSSFITREIHNDYSYLSDLFSSVEGITIEQYFIVQRIEKVKELLVYEELSLTEIAYETGFSSVAHLSAQFKKITGLTSSHFKNIGEKKRRSLDSV